MSDMPKGNALKERKLKLQADPLDNAQQRNGRSMAPSLTIAVVDNQPRFTVYTNVEGDKQNGKIEGNMDAYTFYAVMQVIRDIASNKFVDPETGKPADSALIPNKGFFFDPQTKKRSESAVVKSKTIVGRDEHKRLFIGLAAKGRPFAKFIFGPSEFHAMEDKNGKPLSSELSSNFYGMAFANLLEKMVAQILVDEFVSQEDLDAKREANKQQNRGGGGGGNNYQRGNGGGNNYQRGNNNGGGNNYQRGNSGGNSGGNSYSEPRGTAGGGGGGFSEGDEDIPF